MQIFDPFSLPNQLCHPEYMVLNSDLLKWRLAAQGGRVFIDQYLEKFSSKENDADFALRKKQTYLPAFAKAGLNKVKNKILAQFGNISRKSSSASYREATTGLNGGVDNYGSTMNYFMGSKVLTELLIMGKVAVYVDMPVLEGVSLYDVQGKRPYLYVFTRENIINWHNDSLGSLKNIILREVLYNLDADYGVPTKLEVRFRHYVKTPYGIEYTALDANFRPITDPILLKLSQIPVTIFQLNSSLMEDIADYQIALLNIASSDVSYTIKSNFPFYVEMYDMMAEATIDNIQQGYNEVDAQGNSVGATEQRANTALNKEITTGVTKGRRVPKGLEFPRFINPSPDPLKVSIEKQEQMKREINDLLDLAINNIQSTSSNQDIPSGIQQIGLELESGERKILKLWHEYENNSDSSYVSYPIDYSSKTTSSRIEDATAMTDIIPKIPSNTFRREMSKRAVNALLGGQIDLDIISRIETEIDNASAVIPDPKTISSDVEQGLLSAELGSKLRGYPDGEAEVAQEEHAERLKRIAMAQGGFNKSPAARGLADLSVDPEQEAEDEKTLSQDTTTATTTKSKVRGEAE